MLEIRCFRLWAALAVGLFALPLPAAAVELTGRVELLAKNGRRPARGVDSTAVVYFQPARPAAPTPPSKRLEMSTRNKRFEPGLLAVPRGTTVDFPNYDPILHNVFSVSRGNRFDLGLYRGGPGKSWTFDEPGVVRVFCNVHHDMVGFVVVLDTPYYTLSDAGGAFRLSGLPAGDGTLTVWHPRTAPWTAEVALSGSGSPRIDARLTVSRDPVPAHRDKHGRSYRGRRGRYD